MNEKNVQKKCTGQTNHKLYIFGQSSVSQLVHSQAGRQSTNTTCH